jgi:chemotaxis protein methyltransferase CheR
VDALASRCRAQGKLDGERAAQPPATSSSHATLETATALFQKERFQEALAVLDRDPQACASSTGLQLLRAAILTNQGCLPDAEETCHRILALEPRNPSARYLLAICCAHRGELAHAAELHRRAVEIDPAFAMSHLQMGLLAHRDGDRAAACASLRAALSLLEREDDPTLALLSGGFSRRALIEMCRAELDACGEVR